MKTSSNPFITHPLLQTLNLKFKTLKTFQHTHTQFITSGLIHHTYPFTKLISSLLSSTLTTSLSYALTIFTHNPNPNPTTFIFNTIISSILTHHNHNDQNTLLAFSLYNQMLCVKNIKPNCYTYPSLFKACGSKPIWFKHGLALHTHVIKFLDYDECDEFVQASLIHFYSKSGKFGVCRYLFDQISIPDLGLWNTMLCAYNDYGLSMEVLCLFHDMQKRLTVKANEVTFVALINACADLGAFSQGIWAHCCVVRNGLNINMFVVTALVDLYVNCGFLEFARQVFDELPKKDVFCYNAMIRGFATHGYGHEAIELFKRMVLEGLRPDDVTMVVIISACSHVGLVEKGCEFFYSMREKYGLEPKIEHYGCLVDLLGRAGRVNEALEILQTMPMKPNAVLWRSLLGATRNHGNLDIAEVALDHLVKLEPETSGNYVLLSNIYARMNKWDGVKRVRGLMKDNGIDKLPGTSVLEVGGVFHEFITADKTHPRSEEIYMKLDDMNSKLHEYGHNPRIKEVLFDLENEDSEDALSYHSERLAIAFALLSFKPGEPIRIIKNLRVCVDCHDYTKLVSMIYKREIIVRDRNRFHRFHDGSCSCLDYW